MSGLGDRWRCWPDDGTVHLEAAVLPGGLFLCLSQCEEVASGIEATLRELGLTTACGERGPCQHEEDNG